MRVHDIVRKQAARTVRIAPDLDLASAARTIAEAKVCFAIVIDEAGALAGILTVHDVLRAFAEEPDCYKKCKVSKYMRTDVPVGCAEDSLESTVAFMAERQACHLPVFEGQELLGVLMLRDAIRARSASIEAGYRSLESYVQGKYPG